ncbi:DNA methyltransferase [Luteimonas huabeiensis]|uniref:DNA methyltransferase n=1 Tax=Luteimonas huabeiensis TaxID=1244513 RepID=UPI000465951D|nr:DNA methyltransferase [Luteimonas huabeiensis]
MASSLLDALPAIVRDGRRQAERALACAARGRGPRLRTDQTPGDDAADGWRNRLIHGDNLQAMAALLAGDGQGPGLRGRIDLIYIDPPFDTGTDYRSRVPLPGTAAAGVAAFAYADTWPGGTAGYLRMLAPRLVLMRELLAPTGSLYVHLGMQAGHYVRALLDAVFGREHFVQEIVWAYGAPSGGRASGARLVRAHDVIVHYARCRERRYARRIRLPYDPRYVEAWFCHVDADGRRYQRRQRGRDAEGRPIWTRQYLDESPGLPAATVWSDIRPVYADPRAWRPAHAGRSELTGYGTQKPERLLARIVEHACPPGGLVADFNAGSGTAAAVAERLGRRWIAVDLGGAACAVARRRLIAQGAAPFLLQAVDAPRADGAWAARVLAAYGARPLPGAPAGTGTVVEDGLRTLVRVAPPGRALGPAAIERALALRARLPGPWTRLVVLGWRFEPGLPDWLAARGDGAPTVLRIPPELAATGPAARARARFDSLRRLTLAGAARQRADAASERIEVALAACVPLTPAALDLSPHDRAALLAALRADPLALVQDWSIDPDYDGRVFRPAWYEARTGAAPLASGGAARIEAPRLHGARRICVRATDALGARAELVRTLPAPR